MKRQNIQPDALAKRVVGGRVLYSHVVVVEGRKTIFISGQLARDPKGDVVAPGDMRAQMRQVGENIKAALEAAGATLNDIVKTNTYVTDAWSTSAHCRRARPSRSASWRIRISSSRSK